MLCSGPSNDFIYIFVFSTPIYSFSTLKISNIIIMYYFFFFFVLIYNKVIPIFTAQFNRPTSTYLSNFLLLVNSHNIPWPAYPSRIIYLDRYLLVIFRQAAIWWSQQQQLCGKIFVCKTSSREPSATVEKAWSRRKQRQKVLW